MGQDIYTEAWRRILLGAAKRARGIQLFSEERPAAEIMSLGDRITEGYTGNIRTFAGRVVYSKDTAPFRDLRKVFEEDSAIRNAFPGKLEVAITVLDEISIYHQLIDFADLFKKYRKEQMPQLLQKEKYKFQFMKTFQDRWKEYEAGRLQFAELLSKYPFGNLVDHMTTAPNFNHMAQNAPKEFEKALLGLYDESIDLEERIITYKQEFSRAFFDTPNHGKQDGQEERTIATLLSFRYPDKYALYKDSFYSPLCRAIGDQPRSAGKKLLHYYEEIIPKTVRALNNEPDILAWKTSVLDESCYPDPANLILAQDILYTTISSSMHRNSFTSIIEELMAYCRTDETLSRFEFGESEDNGFNKNADSFVWISDKSKMIGTIDAHYEIIWRKSGGNGTKRQLFVDAHFESEDLEANKRLRQQIGGDLPDGFTWMSWGRSESIGAVHGVEKDDKDVVEKLAEALIRLEQNLGDRIREVLQSSQNNQPEEVKQPLNTILYGPPGTGKTFNSIAHALAIIDGKSYEEVKAESDKDRKDIKSRFDSLLVTDWKNPSGRIGFITFHQSLSYEDFIEGIKPVEPEPGQEGVKYEVRSGIFKDLCKLATRKSSPVNFEEAYECFVKAAESDDTFQLFTPKRKKPFKVRFNSNGSCIINAKTEQATDSILTKEAIRDFVASGEETYFDSYATPIAEYLRDHCGLQVSQEDNTQKPYVLIVDEINRGNVSQIFGELITLIEDGKRTGQLEALHVTLPYSRETFSVPPNLYVIGTMNTADRSVEALDTALRRRFSFIEMPPEDEHNLIPKSVSIAGQPFDFQAILKLINRRLEKLVGRDHKIGHSYFMKKDGASDWKHFLHAFTDKIIPLLQEYFYSDWGRMCLVLGRGFVELERNKAETLFAELPKGETATADTLQDLRERQVWRLATFKKDDANVERRFADALLTLQGKVTDNDDIADPNDLQEDNDA